MPRSLGSTLDEAGFEAVSVRDAGLRGKQDEDVLAHAKSHGLVLISGDLGSVKR